MYDIKQLILRIFLWVLTIETIVLTIETISNNYVKANFKIDNSDLRKKYMYVACFIIKSFKILPQGIIYLSIVQGINGELTHFTRASQLCTLQLCC